jgi:hypothetical protein
LFLLEPFFGAFVELLDEVAEALDVLGDVFASFFFVLG